MIARWPYEPLAAALGGSMRSQARRIGVDERQLYRHRREGLSDRLADRYAIAIGSHPSIIWPGWDEPEGEQLELDIVA